MRTLYMMGERPKITDYPDLQIVPVESVPSRIEELTEEVVKRGETPVLTWTPQKPCQPN